jgi:hypothetical protein
VVHTPGGFSAGYARWEQFKRHGLKSYARLRNDANSYGGLLWCLGLFDRPFKPERPVIGTLLPQSTKDYAKRLNMAAYAGKIKGPASLEPLKIAVIGAGISGLFAARTLMDRGHKVYVFKKRICPEIALQHRLFHHMPSIPAPSISPCVTIVCDAMFNSGK